MRLFIGIPLSTTVIEELSIISARLRSHNDGLRWSSPETWHITLQFLGNTSPEQYQCVVPRLRELHSPSIPIALGPIDIFDRAGVLFAGVRLTSGLTAPQQRVTSATKLCGFAPETRPYQPHITLARTKGRAQSQTLPELKTRIHRQTRFSGFTTDTFVLYESFPGPTGSRYEVRERFPLNLTHSSPDR